MKEEISALLDSELAARDAAAVIETLERDHGELKAAWGRYHLISAALKNELGPVVDQGLADRIAEAIASEPTQLAPARARRPRQWSGRTIGTIATAASLAALTLISVQLLGPTEEQGNVPAVAQSQPSAHTVLAADGTRWETLPPEVENTLNAYLVEHGEFSAGSGLNGLSSYARFVSYDQADQ
jgi:sigma-E factor negative regulatory protein RseA